MRLKFISILLLVCVCGLYGAPKYDVSVCAIFQNEAHYMKEWIDYHRGAGIDHFWLYNNESTDDWLTVLSPYIETGIVDVKDWPDLMPDTFFGYGCQPASYRDCLKECTGKTKWIAFIDLDEYIVPMKEHNIKKTLKKHFKDATAIYVSWLMFGTSYVEKCPDNQMLLYLTRCASRYNYWCTFGKTLVRPEAVQDCQDPHFCILKEPLKYFNGDGEMNLDCMHHDKYLRINHYTYRDEFYFKTVKLPRVLKWKGSEENCRKNNDEFCVKEDFKIIEKLHYSY